MLDGFLGFSDVSDPPFFEPLELALALKAHEDAVDAFAVRKTFTEHEGITVRSINLAEDTEVGMFRRV